MCTAFPTSCSLLCLDPSHTPSDCLPTYTGLLCCKAGACLWHSLPASAECFHAHPGGLLSGMCFPCMPNRSENPSGIDRSETSAGIDRSENPSGTDRSENPSGIDASILVLNSRQCLGQQLIPCCTVLHREGILTRQQSISMSMTLRIQVHARCHAWAPKPVESTTISQLTRSTSSAAQ